MFFSSPYLPSLASKSVKLAIQLLHLEVTEPVYNIDILMFVFLP